MSKLVQIIALFGILGLLFQCDPSFRAWERETLQQLFGDPAPASLPAQAVRSSDDEESSADGPTRYRKSYEGDSPKTPLVGKDADFPGPGWYRVKLWRAWLPENIFQCLDTDYRHITTEDEWWDMYWGTWDREAGPKVSADARMHTTNGIRLDQRPDGEEIVATTND